VLVDGAAGVPFHVGWPVFQAVRLVNVWLPPGLRTGLLPVELWKDGRRVAEAATVRVIRGGPVAPRIVSITDGFNLTQHNASGSGILKIRVEEMRAPDSLDFAIGDLAVERLEMQCIDPRARRYEVNLRLPAGLPAGRHTLQVRVEGWQLPAEIDTLA